MLDKLKKGDDFIALQSPSLADCLHYPPSAALTYDGYSPLASMYKQLTQTTGGRPGSCDLTPTDDVLKSCAHRRSSALSLREFQKCAFHFPTPASL